MPKYCVQLLSFSVLSPVERTLVYKDVFANYITEEVERIYLKEKDPKKREGQKFE